MTKPELIEKISKHEELAGLTKKQITHVVESFFKEMEDFFVKTKPVKGKDLKFSWPGFGTFKRKHRDAKKGRNPKTKAEITIPAHYTISFTPGTHFKTSMNEALSAKKGKK
jgi:DNA-binding protein HU-beta